VSEVGSENGRMLIYSPSSLPIRFHSPNLIRMTAAPRYTTLCHTITTSMMAALDTDKTLTDKPKISQSVLSTWPTAATARQSSVC